jgi:hypothetical protein
MRGAITPTLPHMPLFLVTGGLLVITLLFWWLGIRSFNRRAIS